MDVSTYDEEQEAKWRAEVAAMSSEQVVLLLARRGFSPEDVRRVREAFELETNSEDPAEQRKLRLAWMRRHCFEK